MGYRATASEAGFQWHRLFLAMLASTIKGWLLGLQFASVDIEARAAS